MKKTEFSEEQLKAINTRDRTLLVSAAAGSGKTTTLTERIIRTLIGEGGEKRESLSNMLIVTFTNAAVADMKEKIGKALKEKIIENPDDKELQKELYMLPSARICTIDSFCNEILRSAGERVGVSPGYRIAENAESAILSSSVMELLINSVYEGEMPEIADPMEFEDLSACLVDSKNQAKLGEILLSLYNKTKSMIDGVLSFRKLAQNYHTGEDFTVEKTKYGKDLMQMLADALDYAIGIYKKLIIGLDDCKTDRELFESELKMLEFIREADTYKEAKERFSSLFFDKLKRTSDKSDFQILARNERGSIKKHMLKFQKDFFSYTEDEWKTLFEKLGRALSVLSRFFEKFDAQFVEEKRRRGMLEHSDIERFAYYCLYDKDGNPTDVAKAYSKRFAAVYIDEYQDVNALQDAIFAAVSSKTNRFMVGDIKQSIYRFRSAKPEIFATMKRSYPPLESSTVESGAALFMSANFRCDRGIVDFVNDVFDRAFSLTAESIGYVDADRLVFAKKYDDGVEPPKNPAKIIILEKPPKEKPESDSTEEDDVSDEISEEETETEERERDAVNEPLWVAAKIKDILKNERLSDGSPVKPSDIAILLRTNKSIERFSEALATMGISSETRDNKDFFLNAEVLLALCLLNAIDNPSKDIYLAGLMCSPLYSFTPDELVMIRTSDKSRSEHYFYESVKIYSSNHPENKKLSSFISTLEHYRTVAEGINVDSLIARLYRETGLLSLASKHGGKDNLMLLYNYARKYEGSSYKGLYNFINYINNVISSKASFENTKNSAGDDNAVKLVTVHSSKGLEYPIVFFAETAKKLDNKDNALRFAYLEDYGLSIYLRAPTGLALTRNPVQHIIRENMTEQYIEEELRVLYVALTRAREQLYVVGTCPEKDRDSYLERMRFERNFISEYAVHKSSSFLSLILTAVRGDEIILTPDLNMAEGNKCDTPAADDNKNETAEPNASISAEEIATLLKSRFDYEYPYSDFATLPEKLSVSRLYPTVLDGVKDSDDAPGISRESKTDDTERILPSFYTKKQKDVGAKMGTATHTVLQFCDLKSLFDNGTKSELERLLSQGFITKDDLKIVRQGEIEKFRSSALIKEMLSARKLYREFRFNVRLPASIFTTEEDKKEQYKGTEILVQGVIDCIVENEDGSLTLIDYKTDRLTDEELTDESLARAKLIDRHGIQLNYYKLAIERIFGYPPSRVGIYSLPLGKTVYMD